MKQYKLLNANNEQINTIILKDDTDWQVPENCHLELIGEISPIKFNTIITQLEFLKRFTVEERINIRASTDPIIVDFLHLLNLAKDIDLVDSNTIAGVNYCESIGLLTQGRAFEILN